MELNKKEKFIKTILEKPDHKLDTDLLWDSIEPRVTKPGQEKKWLWFFSGVGSLALLLMLIPVAKNYILAEGNKTNKSNPVSEISTNSESIIETSQSNILIANKSENQITRNENEQIITAESPSNSIEENTTSNAIESQTRNTRNKNPDQSDYSEFAEHIVKNTSDNTSTFVAKFKKNNSQNTVSEIASPENELQSSALIFTDSEANETKGNIAEIMHRTDRHEIQHSVTNIEQLAITQIHTTRIPIVLPGLIKVNRSVKWMPFFAVRGGMNRVISSSEIVTTELGMDPSDFDKENDLFGYSIDLQFGMKNSKGWYFLSGLDLNQIVSRYENHDNIQSTNTVNGVERIYISKDGEVQQSSGNLNSVTITEFDVRQNRRHQSLSLQLIGGKDLIHHKRWSLSTELGVHYNFKLKHSGFYFENKLPGFTSFENDEEHVYRNSTGLGFRGGMNINYHISNITFTLHMFYKFDPKSITNANHFYTIKNKQLGLQLGIAYQLDRLLF